MSDAIIVALITGALTFAGVLVTNYGNRKKNAVEQAKRDQNLDDRLDRLEKKVDEHNGYAKKFGEIEKAIVRIDVTLTERFNKVKK